MIASRSLVPLLFLAGSLSLAAQEAPPETQGSAGDVIDVRVVNVEAVVTGRRGQRLEGLTAADFRLLVDGKEVPIDYFTEIRGGQARAAKGGGPVAPVEGEVGRSVLMFIDQRFSQQTDLDVVLRRLVKDVDNLGPEDRAAVVAYDIAGSLRVLTNWTGDANRLRAALEEARRQPAAGIQVAAAEESLENDRVLQAMAEASLIEGDGPLDPADTLVRWDLQEGASPREVSSLELAAQPGAWEEHRQAVLVGDVTVAALRAFANAPGRKVMLLMSGGWPTEVDPRISEAANLLGYSLYPVDVAGNQAPAVPRDAKWSPPADATEYGVLAANSQDDGLITTARERRTHYSFEVLARETGGKVSLNGNRESALGRTLEDTATYYWIGFSPTWKADGRKHDIRLEVRQRGADVRARRGYSDLSPRAQQALEAESRRLLSTAAPGGTGAGAR
jgi:VWFA-related protein